MIISSSSLFSPASAAAAVHDETISVALEAIKSAEGDCRTYCHYLEKSVRYLEVIRRNLEDPTASSEGHFDLNEYTRIAHKTADRIETLIEQAKAEYQKVPSELGSESRRRLEYQLEVLESQREFAWGIVDKTEHLVEDIATRLRELRVEPESAQPQRLRYCIEVETPGMTEDKVATINELLKSQSIRRAMESAIASTSKYSSAVFKIKFVQDTSFLPAGSPCCMTWWEGTMVLNEGMLFRETAKGFLFELINAIQADRFCEVEQQAAAGRLSREEYTRANEEIEFQTGVLYHSVMVEACREMKWDLTGLDEFAHHESLGFDRYWETWRTTDHAEYYRRGWDRSFKEAFHVRAAYDQTDLVRLSESSVAL